jgi:type I restriction enzyme S subunit
MGIWVEKPLGEILKLTKGISYKTSDYSTEDDGIIFINLKCIAKSGGFSQRGIKYYKGFVPENLKLKSGDVIIANTDLTRNGDIVGCPLILPDFPNNEVSMSMDLSRLDLISDEVDRKFVYYALMTSTARKFMKENSSGSTVLHLKTSNVPLYRISMPSNRVEQSIIATILTTIDQSIEKTEQLITKYQRIKTGLMQDLLTRGIDEQGNIRSEETHEFKESVLGRIPKEWEIKNFESIAFAIDAQPDHRTPKESPDGIHYIGINDLDEYGAVGDNCRKVVKESYLKQRERFTIEEGDIIFGKIGTVGFPKKLKKQQTVAISANVILLKPLIDPSFVYWLLESEYVKRQVVNTAHSTSQAAFGMEKIRNLIIALPFEDEFTKISEIIDSQQKVIQLEKRNLSKLRLQKTALMQDLLTGKVRVDALLEPIKISHGQAG